MRPVRIYIHPDNVEAFRNGLWKLKTRVAENMHATLNPELIPIEIVPCEFVPKGEKTGLYILPGGKKVERDKVRVVERFVTYGPEDLRYLIYSGKVTEEVEVDGYVMEGMDPMQALNELMLYAQSVSRQFDRFFSKGLMR